MQYYWKPQDISIQGPIIDGYYHMNDKTKLANMSFIQAVLKERSKERLSEDVVKSTIHLPQWVRKVVAIHSIDENISEGRIYTSVVNHGAAILQNQSNDVISSLKDIRRTLLGSDNSLIISIVQDFTISVNGVEGGSRRTIFIPIWCKEYLGQVGGNLRMDFSSMIRLTMYLSLCTCSDLSVKDLRICKDEVAQFNTRLNEYSAVCGQLINLV